MEIIISNLIVGVLVILAYTLGLKKGNIDTFIPNIVKVAKNPIKTIKKDTSLLNVSFNLFIF